MESTICYIYVLFWIIWKSRVSLSIVLDPCPDIQPSTQVTDMCQAGSAMEQIGESKDGNANFDHVTLRARIQEDNCTCLVFVENQSLDSVQMYIQPYRMLESSTPKDPECGLELYVDFYYKETSQQDRPAIKCSSGHSPNSFPFYKHSVLRFKSTSIDGNFTRGYCIDIQRAHVNGKNGTLKIVCDEPGKTPNMQMTTESSYDLTGDPYLGSSTAMIKLKDETTIYIAVGVSAGGLFIVIVVLVVIFYTRKSSGKSKKTSQPKATLSNEQNDSDYDGLNYNMLYVSAEHQDSFEGDYHTVENKQSHTHNTVPEHDINYTSVDDSTTFMPLRTVPLNGIAMNAGYINDKDKDNIPSVQNINIYAVVDKKRPTTHVNNEIDAASPTYAVVNNTGKLNVKNKQ